MGDKVTIYGLWVEGVDLPRYIGQTHNTDRRLVAHRRSIEFARVLRGDDAPEQELRMEVLEVVDEEEKEVRERYWIEYFVRAGANLANYTAGAKKTMITFRVTDEEAALLDDLVNITGKSRTGAILQAIQSLWHHHLGRT